MNTDKQAVISSTKMRGIIAAGGDATRVRPAQDKSQQIVYDKPVLYYLLTNLMKAGIRDIIIVCNDRNVAAAETLFRNGVIQFAQNVTPKDAMEARRRLCRASLLRGSADDGLPIKTAQNGV